MAGITRGLPRIRVLSRGEWNLLSNLRLDALKDSPSSFLSSYEREQQFRKREWRAEFSRGEWMVADQLGTPVGLLGTTREPDAAPDERYLWVAPEVRRSGVASALINEAMRRLRREGVSILWLWVLNGNEPARCFYRKHGFVLTNNWQRVAHRTKHYEELMVRHI